MTIHTVHASSYWQKAKYENVEVDIEKKENFKHIVDIAHDPPKANATQDNVCLNIILLSTCNFTLDGPKKHCIFYYWTFSGLLVKHITAS